MELVNSLIGQAVLLTVDGDGPPWDGDYNGEWWWWVLRPLSFILTFLVIAFIVRTVIFGGFRRFNGPGGPRGGGDDRDRDRDRDRGRDREPADVAPSQSQSQQTTRIEPALMETPRAETPRVETPGIQRARDILAERYARGEIDGEEYRGRLEQLG